MLLGQNENNLIKKGNWIGTLWSITECSKNGLDFPQLLEVSARIAPQISETIILLKRIFSLKDEKKSGNKVFFSDETLSKDG